MQKYPPRFHTLFVVGALCAAIGVLAAVPCATRDVMAQTPEVFTLPAAVDAALAANPALKAQKEAITAALAAQQSQKTRFYPTLNTAYAYTRNDGEDSRNSIAVTRPQDEYQFSASITQPVFTGFALTRQYEIRSLTVAAARLEHEALRQQIIYDAHEAYFSVLKSRKILFVAKQAVTQLEANLDVSQNFYDVGMIPLNDLLKSEVELANARQDLIVARNTLKNTEAAFNTLLRRPLEAAVVIEDITGYRPWTDSTAACLAAAETLRPELKSAANATEIAAKDLALARKDFYPTINLEGTYFRRGDDWDVNGGAGIYDPEGWDVTALASWDFWQWGRTRLDVKEKLSRLARSRHQETEIRDRILLEVKQAYLKVEESENNIRAVEKAVEQAKENFRITDERYKEQMATTTDVLDAQTLLSKTMTNYYSALYDFKIARAALMRAMGREILK